MSAVPELNIQVARHLSVQADKLERQGKNKFRIMAYRRAAQSVRSLEKSLWGIYGSRGLKGLQAVKGIGNRIAWDIVKQIRNKS